MAKKSARSRERLADVEREMAKPRLAESVRKAVELAEADDIHVDLLHRPRGRREN